jgi:catechol 2,3-dioxygenase-like lactoylglutathione lyase family enzyme
MPATELLMVTAAVPGCDQVARAWRALSGYQQVAAYEVPADLAALWGSPAGQHPRAVLLAAPGSTGGLLRVAEGTGHHPRQLPVSHPGPFAIEFFSRDADEVADRAAATPGITLISPPASYDLQAIGSGRCRSLVLHAPGGLWMFVTTIQWVPPPRALPVTAQLVGPAVNMPVAAVRQGPAVAFWRDLLGLPIRFDGPVADPAVNKIMLAPEGWAFHDTVFSLVDGQMAEHHFHPAGRLGPAPETCGLPSGAAAFTFRAERLDELIATAMDHGVPTRGPVRLKEPPYDGARVAALAGPHGELVELVEA